jgi:hypothetical protein
VPEDAGSRGTQITAQAHRRSPTSPEPSISWFVPALPHGEGLGAAVLPGRDAQHQRHRPRRLHGSATATRARKAKAGRSAHRETQTSTMNNTGRRSQAPSSGVYDAHVDGLAMVAKDRLTPSPSRRISDQSACTTHKSVASRRPTRGRRSRATSMLRLSTLTAGLVPWQYACGRMDPGPPPTGPGGARLLGYL